MNVENLESILLELKEAEKLDIPNPDTISPTSLTFDGGGLLTLICCTPN